MDTVNRAHPRLAVNGGKPAVTGPLKPFNSIGFAEADAAFNAVLCGPLSGYLGGQRTGGYQVETLEAEWRKIFHVKHAVACNSATSGLLIACMAMGVRQDTPVRTTPYTMSGTIAPATILGANIEFGDIDSETYCLADNLHAGSSPLIIAVNLFGHPSNHHFGRPIIEDAAQSIMATRNGNRAGRTGAAITVFSGNVHKAVQCGEGGMCVTNYDELAEKMRMARNHGELASFPAGLNLRLTEVQAAIWRVQLRKADNIIARRVEIAERLTEMADACELGTTPVVRDSCTHVYYTWALKCKRKHRDFIAKALNAEGFPCKKGYTTPLYELPAFKQDIRRENVEDIESRLVIYENTMYDPTDKQIRQIGEAFKKIGDSL